MKNTYVFWVTVMFLVTVTPGLYFGATASVDAALFFAVTFGICMLLPPGKPQPIDPLWINPRVIPPPVGVPLLCFGRATPLWDEDGQYIASVDEEGAWFCDQTGDRVMPPIAYTQVRNARVGS